MATREVEERGTTYTAGIFENINATSLSEIFKQEAENVEDVISKLESYIQELEASAEAGELTGTRAELEDAIFRRAFLETVDIIQDKALDFITTEAVKAAVNTGEFNYDLYINHLLGAMENNKEGLFGIVPYVGQKSIKVKVNFELLGKPEEWGNAIQAYRKQRGLGKLSEQNKEVGSKVWKEKIYGVGREGGQVKKYFKKAETSLDITGRYKEKYNETVAGRLSYIPPNKAPFWYIIEHGNANVGDKLKLKDTSGVAYPSFGATNFVRNSELAIISAFKEAWTQYEQAARDVIDNLEDERVRELRERAQERVAAGETFGGKKLIEKIKADEVTLEAYNKEWGVQVSARAPSGQWAKLPRGR